MVRRMCLLVGVVLVVSGVLALAGKEEKKALVGNVRIGVFDSRAVAIAYAHSKFSGKIIEAKKAELEKAKADGDSKKVEELEKWGPAMQAKLHKQGFGCASVKDLLKHIEDEIPQVAKEAGVDIIISKWDIAYKNTSAEFVDVTDLIIRPFEPNQRCLDSIKSLADHAPVKDEVLEKMHH